VGSAFAAGSFEVDPGRKLAADGFAFPGTLRVRFQVPRTPAAEQSCRDGERS